MFVGGFAETLRVLLVLATVERGRLSRGPGPLVAELRSVGSSRQRRTEAQRRKLRQVIGRIDAHMPDGGNCYRRVLVEIALDSGAAAEPLFMGLSASGEPMSGHAWLGAPISDDRKSYDAIISL